MLKYKQHEFLIRGRRISTENYILQPSMHIRWLKVSQTPFKKLNLEYASVFRYSTTNDPQNVNDPRCRPQMIAAGKGGMAWSLVFWNFFFIFKFIHFHQLNDELDKHKEKIF